MESHNVTDETRDRPVDKRFYVQSVRIRMSHALLNNSVIANDPGIRIKTGINEGKENSRQRNP